MIIFLTAPPSLRGRHYWPYCRVHNPASGGSGEDAVVPWLLCHWYKQSCQRGTLNRHTCPYRLGIQTMTPRNEIIYIGHLGLSSSAMQAHIHMYMNNVQVHMNRFELKVYSRRVVCARTSTCMVVMERELGTISACGKRWDISIHWMIDKAQIVTFFKILQLVWKIVSGLLNWWPWPTLTKPIPWFPLSDQLVAEIWRGIFLLTRILSAPVI